MERRGKSAHNPFFSELIILDIVEKLWLVDRLLSEGSPAIIFNFFSKGLVRLDWGQDFRLMPFLLFTQQMVQ